MKKLLLLSAFLICAIVAEIIAIKMNIIENRKKQLEHCLKHTNRTLLECDSCEALIYNHKTKRNHE